MGEYYAVVFVFGYNGYLVCWFVGGVCYRAGTSSMTHGLRDIFSSVPSLKSTSTSTPLRRV